MDDTEPLPCLCGSASFERVTVRRADGAGYRTEFVCCTHCRVVYHRPGQGSPAPHPEGPDVDDWAARYRKAQRR